MSKLLKRFLSDSNNRMMQKLAAFSEALAPDFVQIPGYDSFSNEFLGRDRRRQRALVKGDPELRLTGAGQIRRDLTSTILERLYNGDKGPNNINLRQAKALATNILLRNADAPNRALAYNSNTATDKMHFKDTLAGNDPGKRQRIYTDINGDLGQYSANGDYDNRFQGAVDSLYSTPLSGEEELKKLPENSKLNPRSIYSYSPKELEELGIPWQTLNNEGNEFAEGLRIAKNGIAQGRIENLDKNFKDQSIGHLPWHDYMRRNKDTGAIEYTPYTDSIIEKERARLQRLIEGNKPKTEANVKEFLKNLNMREEHWKDLNGFERSGLAFNEGVHANNPLPVKAYEHWRDLNLPDTAQFQGFKFMKNPEILPNWDMGNLYKKLFLTDIANIKNPFKGWFSGKKVKQLPMK